MEPAGPVEPEGSGLQAKDLVVRFGGLTAVDGASFRAPIGKVTGLIGPNGAGKTTTFNACSGIHVQDEGTIWFEGHRIDALSAQARARRGIGRTFQIMELFDSMTVHENVRLGREAGLAGSSPLRFLLGRRRDATEIDDRAAEAIELCGIAALAHRNVASLSTGQRRLVELARTVAGDFKLLLLDEPSSGLDPSETGAFGDTLLEVVRRRGTGILMVEHDMGLVMRICDYLHVLDFGKPLFDGTPDEVANSDVVRAAYLGSEGAVH